MSPGKKNEPPQSSEDDGRTIADMNVDGMPWYTGGVRDPFRQDAPSSEKKNPMSREDRQGYIRAAVGAGLLIGGVFAAAYGLFLLFCRFIWLKY